ncbi:MAG: dihydrofolate reductase [Bacteroidales bacterium]|nr:dihydrofolate reductase [Bacteroidales bacterium]
MKIKIACAMASALILSSCSVDNNTQNQKSDNFNWTVDSFADIEVLRYRVNGFEELSLKQKELIYYLSKASIEGRDILFDQNNRWNLPIRRTLEAIYNNYTGDKEEQNFSGLATYLKRVWFANGIHHHYSSDKFAPSFSKDFFVDQLSQLPDSVLPIKDGQTKNEFAEQITTVIFDPTVYPKRLNQAEGEDLVLTSGINFYRDVTQKEVEDYYNSLKNPNDSTPVSYGLNSRVIKRDGKVTEDVWKVGGLYTEAISKIVFWLEKAASVAENDNQKAVIEKLVDYYKTGNLKTFDEYAILWVNDLDSQIDFINGFTESYEDPLGMKATWEALVNFKNVEATKRTEIISSNAQWFEDNSPVDKQFKKETVKGVSAKVITAAILGGDSYPASPLGINLPNSNWIRAEYGSKSVTIDNISEAYEMASQGNGFSEEFVWSDSERELLKNYGLYADNMHTDLHECLGHGSGKLLPGVDPDALKAYGSPLEEARADLFALYYIADKKLVELGIMPNLDAYKAEYYRYMMNGLMTQLTRIEPDKNIEQAHMRNRQTIAKWVLEKANEDKSVELKQRDGKTFVVINDYDKLRNHFAELLIEIQRIKSTGDYEAGKNLIENYGVKVDPLLHQEILARYKSLNLAPYKGFVNPVYTPVTDNDGNITDVTISYDENYEQQMLRYSKEYQNLPAYN